MNITIKLSDAQVKGLKDYIRETEGTAKPTKEDITIEVRGLVDSGLQTGAVWDYISKYENK